ncbi:MAG: cytochrome P450 [Nostoc sp. NMS1]|uniref:cytochrome P450 n=1 Tax=unclassified Nostoc TaxID=2593658 RepID=UPI0025D75579|nr:MULTISPECIES: cytochrome P450 [unclassified Nostoc]MBN3908642.1 cytochrome P450 [Nostoc sp. NMS1]MBN3992115.1 cytochrome P450 [Nostoc sp. NMS2]
MQLPNPLKAPSLLQKLQWVTDPVAYMENAAQQYPDIFTGKIIGFGDTVVFVNHPKAIQDILTNDRKKFTAVGELNGILQPFLGNYSVLMLEGDRHKRQRQLMTPSFHGERMQGYGELICNASEKIFSQLPLNKPFLARNLTQEISLQVMLQAIFGLYEEEKIQKLRQLLPLLLDLFQSPLTSSLFFFSFLQQDLGAWSPWGKFLRDREQIDQFLYAEIAECKQQPDPERIDILSLLISCRDEAGQPMTDQELRDQLITLILAGYETTALTMAWGLYWIHQKPLIREKLLQELDTLGDYPDPMSIYQLPYLTAVCNEILRIYPVVMFSFPRVVQEPIELLGHHLEPGTVLLPSIYLTHHREDLYPQPKEFQPERFIERQFSPYEFLPFGGGVRRCLGEALAMFQMKLVLATVLSHYHLALVDRRPEQPQRRGFTLAPASGVKMVITGRRVRQKSLMNMTTTAIG